MRTEWRSNLHGVARCPAEYKLLAEGELPGTFEAYVAIFGTPDRPDLFGDSDVIEADSFTRALQEKGFRPIVWSRVATMPPVGQALEAVVREFSFAFDAKEWSDEKGQNGQFIRHLKRLELFEVDPVVVGRHPTLSPSMSSRTARTYRRRNSTRRQSPAP